MRVGVVMCCLGGCGLWFCAAFWKESSMSVEEKVVTAPLKVRAWWVSICGGALIARRKRDKTELPRIGTKTPEAYAL